MKKKLELFIYKEKTNLKTNLFSHCRPENLEKLEC